MIDYDTSDLESIDARTARALTERMSVLPETGRAADCPDLYLVVSESGAEYLVDYRDGACECPDSTHRDAECKHVRRVGFATGDRDRPDWINDGAVDPQLGLHVNHAAVADGGAQAVPDFTYHWESPAQGGRRYIRCEHCGRESVPADPDRILHRADCPLADTNRH